MLSSTMRTLIGGTAPLSIPVGRDGCSAFAFLVLFTRAAGLGEDTLGGGVATRWICRPSEGCGAGGVGNGGATGGAMEVSEALE